MLSGVYKIPALYGHWRLACIIEGVYVRYATGAMGEEGKKGAEMFGGQTVHRAELALQILKGDRA